MHNERKRQVSRDRDFLATLNLPCVLRSLIRKPSRKVVIKFVNIVSIHFNILIRGTFLCSTKNPTFGGSSVSPVVYVKALVNWSCLKIILRQRDREIITLRGSYNSRKQELANYILP